MLAYKGFSPGLVCRGYQFVMGLNVTEKANCAANGFHCAENPLDCLSYYSNMDRSEYYLVQPSGDIDEDDHDSKIACTELTIIKKLGREEFFLHALAYMMDHPSRGWSCHVKKDSGTASYGYVVVRDIEPVACGKKGDILAFAKEDPHTGKVAQIALTRVDGKQIKPHVWYDIEFQEREVNPHGQK